jgi:hypothetical protein
MKIKKSVMRDVYAILGDIARLDHSKTYKSGTSSDGKTFDWHDEDAISHARSTAEAALSLLDDNSPVDLSEDEEHSASIPADMLTVLHDPREYLEETEDGDGYTGESVDALLDLFRSELTASKQG